MQSFTFEIIHQSTRSRARVGRISTPHGIIETPNFVPVATHAALKSIEPSLAAALDIHLMFCNTYHLMLHPGAETVAAAGGLHAFMQRPRPIITDSGGFQVFSLAYGGVHAELKSKGMKRNEGSVLKITEEGVKFRSYRDGQAVLLTPESSIQAQKLLGADIILPLDELPPYHTTPEKLRKSLDRTHRWQARSLQEHKKNPRQQALYGIVHGGVDPELRRASAQFIESQGFDGYAIGGSLGKDSSEMLAMLEQLMPAIPKTAPNHLLGIGDLPSIAGGVPLGIDTFDSSYPSRNARHGFLLTHEAPVRITRTEYRTDLRPIDHTCPCLACRTTSRAYLHHLFKAHEATAYTLATIHNLQYMADLMARYRAKILRNEI